VLSHVNPWNFTARMMIVHPYQLIKLLTTPYDVVHIVMPANLSGMWILASFKILRCLKVTLLLCFVTFRFWVFRLPTSIPVFFTISAPVKASPRSQLALQYCRLHQALLHRSSEVLFVCLLLSTIRNVANDK
jgi:hypothetical protein